MKIEDGGKITEFGVIPNEWEITEVACLGTVRKGKGIDRSSVREKGLPCIRYGEIYTTYNHVVTEVTSFISEETAQSSEPIAKGELLFTGSGETAEDIGKTVVYMLDEPGYAGGDLLILKPTISKVNPVYLSYQWDIGIVRAQRRKAGQGASIFHLYPDALKKIQVILPPLIEQQKIAGILSTVDEHISETEELIEHTKILKQGMMQRLLTKGIGHTEFRETEIGRIPASWGVIPFGSICKCRDEKYQPTETEDLPYVALEDIEQNSGRLLGSSNSSGSISLKSRFSTGNVLFGKLRPYLRKYWLADFDGVCSTEILVFKASNSVLPKLLLYLVEHSTFIEQVNGRSFGSKMPRASWNDIKEILVPRIPTAEQDEIASILTTIDEQIDAFQAKLNSLTRLKSGLMQQLLTGRIRVKV